jgi:hypothetical protein
MKGPELAKHLFIIALGLLFGWWVLSVLRGMR